MGTLQDMDISPPENDEAGDDFLFPDDLEDLDSDMENNLLEDSISIVSTPKPSLRYSIWCFIKFCFKTESSLGQLFGHICQLVCPSPTQPGDF